MKSNVIHILRFNQHMIRDLVESITPADYTTTPKTDRGVALNPAAWLVPHITMALSHTVAMLTGKQTISEDWLQRFGMGSTPSDRADDYPDKAEALAALDKTVEALVAAIDAATDAHLFAPTPDERLRERAPTVGDAVVFLAIMHTAAHTGQLMSLRRCMGIAPRF